jgi:hypothetical protein
MRRGLKLHVKWGGGGQTDRQTKIPYKSPERPSDVNTSSGIHSHVENCQNNISSGRRLVVSYSNSLQENFRYLKERCLWNKLLRMKDVDAYNRVKDLLFRELNISFH